MKNEVEKFRVAFVLDPEREGDKVSYLRTDHTASYPIVTHREKEAVEFPNEMEALAAAGRFIQRWRATYPKFAFRIERNIGMPVTSYEWHGWHVKAGAVEH